MKKQDGDKPLFGRTPKRAEWRVLERLANDMKDHIDHNDLVLITDICQKGDIDRYLELNEYWGLQSINPSVQMVGTRDACLYQLSSFLRKVQWDDTITPEQIVNAQNKFQEYERNMRTYNREGFRKLTWSDDTLTHNHLTRMRHFIKSVLLDLNLDAVNRYSRHGVGGTFGLSSQLGHRFYKSATLPYEVTQSALPMARRLIKSDARWCRALTNKFVNSKLIWSCTTLRFPSVQRFVPSVFPVMQLPEDKELFRVVPGNRIEFVPKDATIARTIALEATMNVMLQLGVDGYIRKRLLKFGIDIDCQEINQNLARIGSIDNSLATIDLAGASDNISMRLIEQTFPYEWVEYLYKLRSDVGVFPDGTAVRYEKLSSMGNGYTFAVETLVFAACVYAVNPEIKFQENAHVYGDDIILPSKDVPALTRLLDNCGFLINHDKSFTTDCFVRESCGADYLRGENIRPVFLKNTLESLDAFTFYSIHNRLKEWFSRILYLENPEGCQLLTQWCSRKWLLFGPPDLEDQSGYLAIADPIYGRTTAGLYRHDRAIATVKKFPVPEKEYYFALLNHALDPVQQAHKFDPQAKVAGGSQFDVTRRGFYKIRRTFRRGRAHAWPRQHHEP